jgi:hypothetical protein
VRQALLAAVAAAATLSASSAGADTAAQAGKSCRAHSEVVANAKIEFSLSCGRMTISNVAIDAGSEIRWIQKRLTVGTTVTGGREPVCRVVGKERGRFVTAQRGDALCRSNVASSALVEGKMSVEGNPCAAKLVLKVAGGGPCGPDTFFCKRALIRPTVRAGTPQGC